MSIPTCSSHFTDFVVKGFPVSSDCVTTVDDNVNFRCPRFYSKSYFGASNGQGRLSSRESSCHWKWKGDLGEVWQLGWHELMLIYLKQLGVFQKGPWQHLGLGLDRRKRRHKSIENHSGPFHAKCLFGLDGEPWCRVDVHLPQYRRLVSQIDE